MAMEKQQVSILCSLLLSYYFSMHQVDDQRPMKDWVLTKESELRIEVHEEDTLDVKVCPNI